jgi:hypothetical protein
LIDQYNRLECGVEGKHHDNDGRDAMLGFGRFQGKRAGRPGRPVVGRERAVHELNAPMHATGEPQVMRDRDNRLAAPLDHIAQDLEYLPA